LNLIREANRVLVRSGVVIVIVPNERSLGATVGWDRYFENHPEHLYGFSIENLEVLLRKGGFGTERTYVYLYATSRLQKISEHTSNALVNVAQKIPRKLILPAISSFMVVGRKNEH
jgi:hypothetical protein